MVEKIRPIEKELKSNKEKINSNNHQHHNMDDRESSVDNDSEVSKDLVEPLAETM